MRRTGTTLSLNGAPYRFDGLNIYQGVQAPCWYQQSFGQGLNDIGSGQEATRLFAFQRTATTNGVRNWSYMDAAIASLHAYGMRAIVVLADEWSGQPCSDLTTDRFLPWWQGGYKTDVEDGVATYRDWVARVVARYANDSAVLAWQLVNEGEARNSDGSCSESQAEGALLGFAKDVGGLVKSIDPNHLVSLGTISGECGSNEGDYQLINAVPSLDLCDYHDYGHPYSSMGNTDSWNGLQVSLDRCHADGKAFMVGEMGIHYTQLTTATTAYRATLFNAKWSAQFTAGSVGELLWTWNLYASPTRDYEVGPTDPSLALTSKY